MEKKQNTDQNTDLKISEEKPSKTETPKKEEEEEESDDEFMNYEKNWTKEELGKEIDDLQFHPLFAKDPQKMDKESKEYKALETLIYDEDDETLQENFYTQGNNILKKYILIKNPKKDEQKHYLREALFKYNEAIERKTENNDLKSKIYCNRAFVNLRLKNYGKAITDSKNAILLNKKYLKAYYRKATGEFELKKYRDCLETCKFGIRVEKEKSLILLRNKAQKKIAVEEEKKEKKKIIKNMNLENILKHLEKEKILYAIKNTLSLPPVYENIFVIENKKIKTSIIFIYPEFSQFDFVKKSSEEDLILNHFYFIFQNGLPWDTKNLYNQNNIELFVEINAQKPINGILDDNNKKLSKIGTNFSILDCLKIKGFVVPRVLEVVVLCKDSDFYNHFTGRYM